MKIGYIVDSSSGLSKKDAEKRGWLYLPLQLTIDKKDYKDGVNLLNKTFYNLIKDDSVCKTSATSPGEIINVFKKASEKFDHTIVYGLSVELSSQTSNLINFAKDFDNVSVVKSYGVGKAIVTDLEKIKENNFKTPKEILNFLNTISKKQFGIAFPKELSWLVKGGRISSSIAGMANLLKIIPIIKFENGKLDKYGKGRIFEKAISKTMKSLLSKHKDSKFMIYHGKFDGLEKTISNIEKILGDCRKEFFPPVIAAHTGPKVIAVMIYN